MGYIYAMSDIHGCLDAFEYALSLIDLSGDNKIVLLGDYVHGPDSYGVLRLTQEIEKKEIVYFISVSQVVLRG